MIMALRSKQDLLVRLLVGKEPFRFLIIQENVQSRASDLFKCFVKEILDRKTEFQLVLLQSDSIDFPQVDKSRIKTLNSESSSPICTLKQVLEPCTEHTVILVDSLNSLFLSEGRQEICRLIQWLSTKFSKIITCFSRELVDPITFSYFTRLASTSIVVSDKRSKKSALIVHKKRHRKMEFLRETEECFYGIDKSLWVLDLKPEDMEQRTELEKNRLPEASFNLNLKQEEEQTRSQIILPYAKRFVFYPCPF